jgi:outer membrane receptor protein involved in Fe transport
MTVRVRWLSGTAGCLALIGAANAQAAPQQAAATSAPASADVPSDNGPTTEEIVVTARFRKESAQNIGESIAVIGNQQIKDAGLTDFTSLAVRVPGLNFSSGGPNRNVPRIRGISQAVTLQDSVSAQPLISQSINEISINAPGFNQFDVQLFDIGRVEVLKGPQGTRFGEGASGGAIRYFLPDPDLAKVTAGAELSGHSTKSGGKGIDAWAGLGIPLVSDKLAIRGTVYHRGDDGFIDNAVTGKNDVNTYRSTGARLSLLYKPTDAFTLSLFGVGEDTHLGADQFVSIGASTVTTGKTLTPRDLTIEQPAPSGRDEKYRLVGGKMSYNLGPVTLESITGYFTRDTRRLAYDATFTFFLNAYSGVPGNVTLDQTTKAKTFSQELRALTNFDGPLNFVVGGFYRHVRFTNNQARTTPGITTTSYDGSNVYVITNEQLRQRQISGFVDGSLKLGDQVTLLGGVRYLHEKIEGSTLDGFNAPLPAFGLVTPPTRRGDTISINRALPRASIEFRPAPGKLLYASFARGARNGGINSPVTADFFPDPKAAIRFGPDAVSAYEVGAKTEWLDGRLVLNAAAYYNDFQHIQIFVRDPVLGSALTQNGPSANIYGVELEAELKANSWLTLSGRGSYTDAKFRGNNDAQPGGGPIGSDPNDIVSGDRVAYTPRFTYNGAAQVRYPVGNGHVLARADYSHISSFIDNVETQEKLEGYERFDLRLGYEWKQWSFTIYANNVTNRIPILANSVLEGVSIGVPRQIGASLRFTY